MKTEEENFDDFLKRKLPNEQVPFKDKYWQNALTMLDGNRPQKKRYGFILFMSALFFVAISAVLFNHQNNKVTFTPVTPRVADAGSVAASVTLPVENTRIGKEILSDASPTSDALSLTGLADNDNNINRNTMQRHSSQLIQTPDMAFIATKQPEHTQYKTGHDDEPKQAIKMEEQDEASEKSAVNMIDETVLSNKPASATLIEPRWKVTLETEGYQPLALKGSEHVQQRSASYKMLEAGINFYNPGSDAASNFNFHLGIKYCFNIAPRLSLATGVSYSRQHQNNGKRTYNSVSYGFGEKRETIGINTIRLDYLEVPLSLFYSIKGRHGLIAGVSCNYLVQSADLIKQANEISYKEKSSGYYAAFNRFDVQLHAGYTYTLNTHILVSAAYYAGIIDVTKNSAFRSGEFNTNKGLRLTLGYQLY